MYKIYLNECMYALQITKTIRDLYTKIIIKINLNDDLITAAISVYITVGTYYTEAIGK